MRSVKLRDYQLELVDAVWSEMCRESNTLAVLPTGGGKTVCIAELMRKSMEVKPSIRIAMVMGRIDLVKQTERALAAIIPRQYIGVYCGTLNRRELSRPIIVASIQSISDVNMTGGARPLDLLVIDEVHNLDQKNGRYLKFLNKAQERNPKLKVVGFTATPFRTTGEIYGPKMLFPRIAFRKTIKEMIELGYLAPPVMKGSSHEFDTSKLQIRAGEYRQEDVNHLVSDETKVIDQVKDALSRMDGKQAVVWACANIDHCNLVANTLMSLGEKCTTVHSKLSTENRNMNLAQFMGGAMRHMSFVTILSEGFDHPPIDCVVLMRPTRSPVLYVQTVGRGLRPFDGKKNLSVLDYGQVVKTLGPLDDPKIKGKKTENGEAILKECPQCFTFVFGGLRNCSECEYEFPPPSPPQKKLDIKSDGTGVILSKEHPLEIIKAGPIELSMYEAKSGNQCVRIIYCDSNFMTRYRGGTSEYFVTNSPWAVQRLEARLSTIGAQLPGIPFDGTIVVDGTFEVTKKKDGKYERVISVKKISEVSPETEEKKQQTWLDKLDTDDTSFDFGANKKEHGWIGQG